MDRQEKIRLYSRIAILAFVLIIVVFILYSFIFKGTLEISTNSQSIVSISKIGDANSSSKQGKKVSFFTKPGDYKVAVKSDYNETTAIAHVGLFKKTRLNLQTVPSIEGTILRHEGFKFPVVDASNRIIALDEKSQEVQIITEESTQVLKNYSGKNPNDQIIIRPLRIDNLKGYDAIVFYRDGFCVLSGMSCKIIDIPTAFLSDESVRFGVASSKDGVWMLGNGKLGFYAAPFNNSDISIQEVKDWQLYDQIAGSADRALIYASYSAVNEDPEVKKSSAPNGLIYSKRISTSQKIEDSITSASWSPDGKNLALISSSDNGIKLYKNSDPSHYSKVSLPGINLIQWSRDNVLYYSDEDELWKYSVENVSSTLHAKIVGSPTSLFFGNGYILATTYSSQKDAKLWMISSDLQKNEKLKKIQQLLPRSEPLYTIGYQIGLTGIPQINVQLFIPRSSSISLNSKLYESNKIQAITEVNNFLSSNGINPSQTKIIFTE